MIRINRLIKRLRNDDGVAAIEFAIIFPFLVLLYLGSVELSFAMIADRKVTTTAQSLADLIAQVQVTNKDELDDIYFAAKEIMEPYDTTKLGLIITSVDIDGGGAAKVDWSRGYGTSSPRAKGASVTVPADLQVPNSSLILAETTFAYDSGTRFFLKTTKTLGDQFYMRPRLSDKVVCADC